MRNHNQKQRDIARSVLPSTFGPKAQRWRRNIHHAERAAARAVLRDARGAGADFDDHVDYDTDRWLKEFREERRYADKVGPLVRWARRTVEVDPDLREATLEERLDYFRAILPDNLIGQHALSHLEWELDSNRHVSTGYRRRWLARDAASSERLHAALRRIVDAGAVGELNAELKRGTWIEYVRMGTVLTAVTRGITERFQGGPDIDRFHEVAIGNSSVHEAVLEVAARRGA